LRILSSVFLIEMFDLRATSWNTRKNCIRLQDMWVELKLSSWTTSVRCFEVV